MEALMLDLRFSYRILLKNPGFAAIAVLTLALGIGACTAIFSIVDGVLLRALPYPEPDRLVQMREVSDKGSQMAVAEPNFLDLRERSRSLEAVAQYSGGQVNIVGGSEPARVRVSWVSGDFFRVMGVQPFLGRAFTPEESRQGADPVAVIGYGLWQRLFGAATDISGRTFRINTRSFTVIGVMPPGFNFPQKAEMWIARELSPPQISRSGHNWSVVARLGPGTSLEAARADASSVAKQLKQEHGKDMDAVDFALIPLQEYMVGNVRYALLIILGAVAFLLLVACSNVANLLLARATARRKELTVRAALGATRSRLAQQFIAENLFVALPAAALGGVLSYWGVSLLISLNQSAMPRVDEIGVDARAFAFTLGLSLLIAIVLGIIPVMRLSREDLQSGIKDSGRGQGASRDSNRMRSLLVVSQMALTLILLICAGLLIKSFYRLLQNDPGFRPESAVVMDLSLPRYEDPEGMKKFMLAYRQLIEKGVAPEDPPTGSVHNEQQKRQLLFHEQLIERVGQLPGVTAVGSINRLPMSGAASSGTFFIGNDPSKTGYAEYRLVTPGYFAAMEIPVLRGRLFDQNDRPESPPSAVISQSLAQRYWPDEDPIGKRIQFGNMDGDMRLLTVVGVVGDVLDRGLDNSFSPTVYAYAMQRPQSSDVSIVARAHAGAATLTPAMRQAVGSLNPELPTTFRTLEEVFSSSLDSRRFSLVIFAVFGAVALTLAVLGIYGVMSYAVTQRTQEIGIRIALGAQTGDVLRLVVRQGLILALLGIGIGLAGAFLVTRLMSSLLYGVSARDPLTFILIPLLLAAVALLASYVPARRAARVDPMVALRYE
ncbi:MAG TPA: ABC transporter permease [Blastocatellia bacterium]|nr:ABC transporter permease [Blastocatellia bacterium]